MVDRLAVTAGIDVRSDENRGYELVIGLAVRSVLVPREDQEAVVGPRPLDVTIHIGSKPCVARLDHLGDAAAIVHFVILIRNDEGDGRQLRVVGGKVIRRGEAVDVVSRRAKRDVEVGRNGVRLRGVPHGVLLPIDPGAVFQRIVAASGAGVANPGQVFRVALESVSLGQQRSAQVGRGHGREIILAVVRHALVRAGEKAEIVRLARMRLGMHVGEQRAAVSAQQRMVDVWGVGGADNLAVVLVFLEYDDDVVVLGEVRRPAHSRKTGKNHHNCHCQRRALERQLASHGNLPGE